MWNEQLLEGNGVGNRVSMLDLGRAEGNSNVHQLYHHEHLEGNVIARDLAEKGVITDKGDGKLYCLNFVSVWGSAAAGFIVGVPVFSGFLCCVIWPIVAVRKYNADVQTSVQTGFAVGSFIVTASALLIALVTFLDAVGSNRGGERISESPLDWTGKSGP
ncbi:hypothetical protein N8I77_000406 [Diaporthe amygdali]|uniref:Uncharacterized protein n=1 Tax=Phomopsis amygdali TaxID=1214568 RepID=A0AAD9SPP8_PHOAM|nr:hypothetical protein N8I77_000406 [Diaporthe amygdali]